MNNDALKTMLAFAGGAIAGAAIAILFAPDKGSETRKKILAKAKDMSNGLSDAAMEKYDEFISWKDSLMDEAQDTIRKTEQTVKNTTNEQLTKAENKLRSSHV